MNASWVAPLFAGGESTPLASFTSEASLLAGNNRQPAIPPLYFDVAQGGFTKSISLIARGVLGCNGTPTYLFHVRLGTTLGSAYLSGTIVGITSAITCQATITNKLWELRMDLQCTSPGLGSNNTTLTGAGMVTCPGGFAAPYGYPIEPTAPDTATWTSTIDCSLAQYLNLSATCSASDVLNTITCKSIFLLGFN